MHVCFVLSSMQGPVISRTSDLMPLLGNIAGFAAAALAVGYQHKIAEATGLSVDEPEG